MFENNISDPLATVEISHEAAEQTLRNQATHTDEHFVDTTHVSHQLALLQGHVKCVFLHTVWRRQRRWDTGAVEVSVRRGW